MDVATNMLASAVAVGAVVALSATPAFGAVGGWAPARIEPGLAGVSNGLAAGVDAQGDVLFAGVSSDGTNARVFAQERRPDGSSSDPVELSAAGNDASAPRIVEDAAGDAVVAWTRSDGSNAVVQTASRVAHGSFGAPVSLSASGHDASTLTAAIDAAGDAVVGWLRSNGSHVVFQIARRSGAGGSFDLPEDVSSGSQDASYPDVALNGAGRATAAWDEVSRVEASTAALSGSFAAPAPISPSGETTTWPQVAVGDADAAAFTWSEIIPGPPMQIAIRGAVRAADGTLSPPQELTRATSNSVDWLWVGMDAEGDATAVWNQGGISAALGTQGGPFGAATLLDSTGFNQQLAVDPAGHAVIAWTGADHDGNGVGRAVVRSGDGPLSAPALLTPAGNEDIVQQVAVAGDGQPVVLASSDTLGQEVLYRYDRTPPAITELDVPATADAGDGVAMTSTATDDWGAVQVRFDFGDGTSAAGSAVRHTYTSAGPNMVTVTATDAAGNATVQQRTITVGQPPAPSGSSGGGDASGGTGSSAGSGSPAATGTPAAGPAPATGGSAGAGASPPSPSRTTIAGALTRLLSVSPRLGSLAHAKGATLTFAAPAAGTLQMSWSAAVAGSHGKPVVLASGTAKPSGAQKVKLTLHLTAAGRRAIRQAHAKLRVKVSARFTSPALTTPVSISGTLTLRR
jgi:hypothetical protein